MLMGGDTQSFRSDGSKDKPSFMFLAHWVESWNWLLWWVKDLHRDPNRAWLWVWLAPAYLLASILYLVGRRAYDCVDHFTFGRLTGQTWLIRNFGWHFILPGKRKRIKRRILEAVRAAAEAGISVIGLGALTKAEWLTQGGKWVVNELRGMLTEKQVWIVHGDTLTAGAVIHQLRRLIAAYELEDKTVFLTGGTSKIGRAIALALARDGVKVYLLTASQNRVNELQSESGETHVNLVQVRDYKDGRECPIWITGKAEPGAAKGILTYAPKGAIILSFSVPDPLSPRLLQRRPDLRHIDGGLMGYDPRKTTLHFTMRLVPGITYACHAGAITHAFKGWQFHEVDKVDMDRLDVTWAGARDAGFFLPNPTSFLRPVSIDLPPCQEERPLYPYPIQAAQTMSADATAR